VCELQFCFRPPLRFRTQSNVLLLELLSQGFLLTNKHAVLGRQSTVLTLNIPQLSEVLALLTSLELRFARRGFKLAQAGSEAFVITIELKYLLNFAGESFLCAA
jgi:hypothetical protein